MFILRGRDLFHVVDDLISPFEIWSRYTFSKSNHLIAKNLVASSNFWSLSSSVIFRSRSE